ncbi:hypothetical protein Tdes44962_MAKER02714 [Teratosphaeria destructans]|uniref:Uncharacterized protein n=1 Tax=Teratosphaeria destructans TaxID=418781 RepID=A0A9W7W2K0_9PEZI|nr:hypothetical protein Tdes44962_MAKER02714 [Teratosphaeria destructans]
MATNICYAVTKFSFATGLRPDASVPWQHHTSDQLFVILTGKDTRLSDGRLRPDGKLDMRIVDHTQVMESVDIGRCIDDADDAQRRAQEARIAIKIEQLPIFGITKDSLLAVRYRLVDGQARRLQLRLEDSAKCEQIVRVFERRGMQFQERRPRTARPGTATSTATATMGRQSTSSAHSSSTSSAQVSRSHDHAQVLGPTLSAGPPGATTSTTRPAWLVQGPPVQPLSMWNEATPPGSVMPDRPTTSQLHRSFTMANQQSQASMDAMRDLVGKNERPSSSSLLSTIERIRDAVEDDSTLPHTSLPTPDALRTSEELSSGVVQPVSSHALSSDPARILTSTTTMPPPESQEFELPPRRELPFKRPDSKRSGTGKESSSKPPLLPKLVGSGLSTRSNDTSLADNSANRPSTAVPQKRSSAAVEDAASRPQTSLGLHSCAPPRQAADKPEIELPEQPRVRHGLLNGREPLAPRSTNTQIPRVSSLVDAEHEIDPQYSPNKRQAVLTQDPTTNIYAAIRATGDPNVVSLEEYATQSWQDRQAALEEFMISNLKNPAFAKLCEDVDNCWRKLILGL